MSDLPLDLLTRSAEQATRLVALDRLAAAAGALERRAQSGDSEGLHDFRVALRRLRSLERAYRPYFKGAGLQRVRRRLRQLTRATNAGRDAEVLLDWLRVQYEGLSARERLGWRWLVARTAAREHQAGAALDDLARRFAKLAQRLRRRLGRYQLTVNLDDGAALPRVTFGVATAQAMQVLADDLSSRLADPPTSDDAAAVHAARISAKRLRYLLEPVAAAIGGAAVVERLRELQDVLGELNDAHVASRELAAAVEAAAAERARLLFDQALQEPKAEAPGALRRDERPGLIALARLARQRWERGFAQLEAEWLDGKAQPLFAGVARLATALSDPTPTRPVAAAEPEDGGGRWSAVHRADPPRRRVRPGV